LEAGISRRRRHGGRDAETAEARRHRSRPRRLHRRQFWTQGLRRLRPQLRQAVEELAPAPLKANDAVTGKPITNASRLAQIWLVDEPLVRHYSTPESALKALAGFEKAGKPVRAVYAHDRNSGIKLLANLAWFVKGDKGQIDAFLLKGDAEAYAKAKGGARWSITPPARPPPRAEGQRGLDRLADRPEYNTTFLVGNRRRSPWPHR
jgi:hypothetical protein